MKKKTLIPLLFSTISAGFPSPADDYIDKSLDLNELLIKSPSSTFFVRVSGDSMKDIGIFNDDILIVDKSLKCNHNDIIIAFLDSEFLVKRLFITKKNEIFLLPENRNYKPIKVINHDDFTVWGKVTYVIHKPK
jgi:DNA polymerase V